MLASTPRDEERGLSACIQNREKRPESVNFTLLGASARRHSERHLSQRVEETRHTSWPGPCRNTRTLTATMNLVLSLQLTKHASSFVLCDNRGSRVNADAYIDNRGSRCENARVLRTSDELCSGAHYARYDTYVDHRARRNRIRNVTVVAAFARDVANFLRQQFVSGVFGKTVKGRIFL